MKIEEKDLEFISNKGISVDVLEEQLHRFETGFPWLKIESAATPGNGISILTPAMEAGAVKIWEEFLSKGGNVLKMVPASGAASRMFKEVFAFVNGKNDKPNDFMMSFFDNIEKFAFFNRLNLICIQLYAKGVLNLIKEKHYKDVALALIDPAGLNYGQLPKALLEFHKILGDTRSALSEHLAEGAQYALGNDDTVKVHFTVSENHLPLMQMKVEEVAPSIAKKFGVNFDISYSVQKPSTDTVAVTMKNQPYRENGQLFFRPGGHGALIENLNDLTADIIFIKNIDNVVPDSHRDITNHYKKVIGGTLVAVKQRADEFCKLIKEGNPTDEQLEDMLHFLRNVLCITHDKADEMDQTQKADYIYSKLNRPFRVAGMVRNEGEPGGGPYLVYNPDGTVSPQILESTQINEKDKKTAEMMKKATHFNPVDLVVATHNWKGEKFNLPDFVDKATGFISEKSREGVEIKALELPGLWNGAMSDWNTIFVEVPIETFNPVKTINDLLRDAHQVKEILS